MPQIIDQSQRPWTRTIDGPLFGVCGGIARRLDLNPTTLRIVWLICSLFVFGAFLYLVLAVSLPREDRVEEAKQPMLLGVCHQISQRTDIEVGIVRAITFFLMPCLPGLTLLGYFVAYFLFENKKV